GRWDGSFVPFARGEAERHGAGDPRPSIAARYATRAAYERKVRAAAQDVARQGFLLPDEIGALVSEAGGLYDRIMAHDPADPSCRYLFAP
ncbi:MAG: alpha/beta hydrolase domain-containing protein, partial [Xanthobacteraceae bacterium]